MSWPNRTKTHKLVRVLGNGPFPDQGPVVGAHGADSPTQQYDFFAEQKLKISVFFMQQIKSYSIFTARQTDTHFASQDFFLYGNLYLSLHFVPSFALLSHSLHLWRIKLLKFAQILLKFYLCGEISPSLVTLVRIQYTQKPTYFCVW